MNDRTLTEQLAEQAIASARMESVFEAQRHAFLQNPCPDAGQRRQHLRALKRQLLRYQDVLAEAIDRDFGERSLAETKMLEVLPTTLEINHAISHVRHWMRASRRRPELLFASNSLRVTYQPKGVVGVIATWNFPVYLSLGPLVAALAAGNRVMIKMPETTPATNATLRQMLGEVFTEDHVALVGGELADPGAFTALPFNHIVFTGSPAVGRIVMGQAARNLTPVTLELGGKSPAIVLRDYPVREAARRIAHGKGINCGQVCVAPDYALVPRERVDEFVKAVVHSFGELYGKRTAQNADYTALASDRHAARIKDMLEDARAKGATVIPCGEVGPGRRLPLHVVTNCTPDMTLMREEIFGPVLPVVPYDTHEQAIEMVQRQARPLALYCFSHDASERGKLLARTHSGGVTINDWAWHVVNHDAPFGGVGQSGMGNYHGEEGFRELSHARTVFKRHRFFPIELFYPPYGNLAQRLTLKLFAGHGDPAVKKPF
ncbi:coniferyl aldehyde dehydrogenase [Cupriavidus basilensis]|uniref:coniferyl aldehyde dehydrogenase n=1 Tax=Cupriavidus basilensis TaxID=68895 RepID=UPI0023E7B715|nr:coniferyl aldehyde dehydrogenase [Cupriavidus basilensis]MDF3883528.1 coniferyl aldehyde dehydrogenase [Cupriavidus basilensis]